MTKYPILAILALLVMTGCQTAAVTGGSAATYSFLQERSVGNAIDDTGIGLQITSNFAQENVNELLQKVSVEVHEGRVLLTGMVESADSRVEAVRLAWQPRGVKEVINEIQVSDKNSLEQYMKDSWVTSQVRGKIMLDKDIRSINYSIETVNEIVYLMGVAQHDTELNKVANHARKVKGVTKVISHVKMKDDPDRN